MIDAKISITDITTTKPTNSSRRSTEQTNIDFVAVCSLELTEEFDFETFKYSLSTTVLTAKADHFDFFDQESFKSFSFQKIVGEKGSFVRKLKDSNR